ncbi:dihydroxyacetone kinase subunit L [Rhodococcus sp. BP-241]|uniref:dihydroxyacetone kinase subunit DhaL n=1 Tax=Rhodococcus sp. BP-241 TaxID=2739441 RepID=UPI001C9B815C|nr:dihydroxyacetone kinase subunit DhaL [Rhodococcus sp. BP-241]MBY6706376.1 dihydroxyacetone kinase subunit L [Rhodococcus sp. BP-241]
MSLHKMIDDPSRVIVDACRAAARRSADLRFVERPGYFTRRERTTDGRVAVMSGGGSGHEPLHSGFVGAGMLDAAVPGSVFTSPNALQIEAATRAVEAGAGVIHVVKNYTGDVINFRIAADLCAADGITVETVLVADDVASESEDGPGRRGTAATVAVEKICGAAAARGDDLASVAALGRRVAEGARSMAVAFRPCTVPGASSPSFELGDDEVELGVGIHGERGTARVATLTATEIAEALLGPVADSLGLSGGEDVVLIVNGLGATHPLELDIVFGAALRYLEGRGITVRRTLVGSLVTAFDMAGVSLTAVRCDDEILGLWDAPTEAPAWPRSPAQDLHDDAVDDTDAAAASELPGGAADPFVTTWVSSFVERVRSSIDELTDLDRRAGDGDFGVNMEIGLADFAVDESASPAAVFEILARGFLGNAGGTSGALFGAFFHRVSVALDGPGASTASIAAGVADGLAAITDLGGAQPGDKTMVDALDPASRALGDAGSVELSAALAAAAEAATRGAESTTDTVAQRGRASYIGDAARGVIDPGALVVSWFFAAA